MTTRRPGGRDAVTHYLVKRKLNTVYGKFRAARTQESKPGVRIDPRSSVIDQSSSGGDALYGAARELKSRIGEGSRSGAGAYLTLDRNFLHSAALQLKHPEDRRDDANLICTAIGTRRTIGGPW